MNDNALYPAPACETQTVGPTTVTSNLTRRKERLERELASVNEALIALAANPEVEKILNLISKANH